MAEKGPFLARQAAMAEVCYEKVADSLRRGYQAMVFVHSRKDTGKTARQMAECAQKAGEGALFNGRRAAASVRITSASSTSAQRAMPSGPRRSASPTMRWRASTTPLITQ